MRRVGMIALLAAFMVVAAACNMFAETHHTLGDALNGNPGDRVELAEAQLNDFPGSITRRGGTNEMVVDIVDREGNEMEIRIVQPNISFDIFDFVSVTGRIEEDLDGHRYIWISAGGLRHIDAPADWPHN